VDQATTRSDISERIAKFGTVYFMSNGGASAFSVEDGFLRPYVADLTIALRPPSPDASREADVKADGLTIDNVRTVAAEAVSVDINTDSASPGNLEIAKLLADECRKQTDEIIELRVALLAGDGPEFDSGVDRAGQLADDLFALLPASDTNGVAVEALRHLLPSRPVRTDKAFSVDEVLAYYVNVALLLDQLGAYECSDPILGN
jgi:hypothetical protein